MILVTMCLDRFISKLNVPCPGSIIMMTDFFLCHFLGIFVSTCSVDVRWFPFDIQRCELKFGSWTFDGWLLDIQMKEADVSGYMPNGEWDLMGTTGTKL